MHSLGEEIIKTLLRFLSCRVAENITWNDKVRETYSLDARWSRAGNETTASKRFNFRNGAASIALEQYTKNIPYSTIFTLPTSGRLEAELRNSR